MRNLRAAAIVSLFFIGGTACAQSNAGQAASGPWTLGAEALVMWFKGSPTPVPIITDGRHGQPGTTVLLGGGDVDTNPNPGVRVTAAYALNPRWGIEGSYFYIGKRSASSGVSSSGSEGSTDLMLPYFNVNRNREDDTEISLAPIFGGSATAELSNSMMGAEANAAWPIDSAKPWNVGFLAGLRWLQLKETYTITTSSPNTPPQPLDIWTTTDQFDASNNFYGAQFGARARYDSDRWFGTGVLQVGLGAMVQTVDINGSLVTNDFNGFGAAQTFAGGYFALPTNIGNHSRTVFAAVPELRLSLGYKVTPAASLIAGYNVLYASNVVRPGNQIDRNINPTQGVAYTGEPPAILEGPAQPAFGFNNSSFWAQGLSIALNVRF